MQPSTPSARANFPAAVVMLITSVITVLARFGIRFFQRQVPIGPDWLCLVALVLFVAYCALVIDCELCSSVASVREIDR
jgi:hypothetical protein